MTLRPRKGLWSAHINSHHTASILEVGCRQLRRIYWAGRPIRLFLFAFRRYAPPADDETILGGATQSAATLCECCVARCLATFLNLWRCRTIGLDDRPPQRVAALRSGAGAAPPKLYRMLGHAFSRGRSFIRVRLPPAEIIPAGAWNAFGLRAERTCPPTGVGGSH